MYSLLILLALSSMYFFIKLFEEKSFKNSAGYVLVTAFLLYTHYSGIFIIVIQNIYILTLFLLSKKRREPDLKRWFTLQGVLAVLFLPWLVIAAKPLGYVVADSVMMRPPPFRALTHPILGYTYSRISSFIFLILTIPLLASSRENYRRDVSLSYFSRIYLLFLWLSLPIVLLFTLSHLQVLFYVTKYSAAGSMALYLLVAQGIINIRHKYARIAVSCVVISLFLIHLGFYYKITTKNQWSDASKYICENAKTEDLLIFQSGYFIENVFDYYCKRKDLVKIPFPEKTRRIPVTTGDKHVRVTKDDIKEIWPVVKPHKRVWLILCHGRDEKRLSKDMLSRFYNVSYREYYGGIEVIMFTKEDFSGNENPG